MRTTRIAFLLAVLSAPVCSTNGAEPAATPNDPLPSWNDTNSKQAILEFVGNVTDDGGPDFVPVAKRIAVFDNDGTLWSE